MERYINCSAHCSSDGNLLIGDTHTALFDCGMAFCANDTIKNVKNALNGRQLDYIFLSHTHYDHIGALPFFRQEWPQVRVVTSEIGAGVLVKNTPRRIFREFSEVAAKSHGTSLGDTYDVDAFYADIKVKDKDIVSLGGISVEVLETPGHTKDALSFFIPELELLIVNETPGVLMPDGYLYPCYLTGYLVTINSVKKCREIQYKLLSLPHTGIVSDEIANGYFDRALENNTACRDFIVDMKNKGLSEEDMLEKFTEKYSSETLLRFQPIEAFIANARATIACTLRDLSE